MLINPQKSSKERPYAWVVQKLRDVGLRPTSRKFSNWSQNPDTNFATGRGADPRSFCIQKTLMDIAHGGALENNLMFAGHSAFNFATDPFFSNGFVPTVKQLFDRILTGD